jgi:Mrp family chromosome partitioning ATPase
LFDDNGKAIFANGQHELRKLNEFNKVQKVVAVMSGKGGVGKSTARSCFSL